LAIDAIGAIGAYDSSRTSSESQAHPPRRWLSGDSRALRRPVQYRPRYRARRFGHRVRPRGRNTGLS